MGTVYRAHDTLLGRPVALKLLEARAEGEHLERFRREVLAGQEGHPYLVQTYEAGMWDGRLFLAMQLVAGGSLKAQLARGGALGVDELGSLAENLLAGLAHLHGRGIVHREVMAAKETDTPFRRYR